MDNFLQSFNSTLTMYEWTGGSRVVSSSLGYYESRTQNSVNTPGFRSRRPSSLPMNPYSKNVNIFRVKPGTLSLQSWNGSSWVTNSWQGNLTPQGLGARLHSGMATSSPQPMCVNKALSRLSLSGGSVAVTLAEADKTAAMVANAASRLARAFRYLKSGNLPGMANSLNLTINDKRISSFKRRRGLAAQRGDLRNFSGNSWLEYSYGWVPFVSDVFSQAENLANYMVERQLDPVRTVTARHKTTKQGSRTVAQSGGLWKVRHDELDEKEGRIVLNYRLAEAPSVTNVFGLNNPALVAWELLPFSFVYDWFLPIGNYLENLSATSGLVFHSGTYAEKGVATIVSQIYPGKSTGSGTSTVTCTQAQGVSSEYASYKNRSVLTSFPSVPLPSFRQPAGVSKLITSLALLNGVFGRR